MYARAPVGKTAKTSCPRNTPDTTSSCFGFKAAYPKSCAALFAAISTSRLSSASQTLKAWLRTTGLNIYVNITFCNLIGSATIVAEYK